MRRILSLAVLCSICFPVFAQEKTEKEKVKEEKVKPVKEPYKFNPSIGAGIGVTRYAGDVEDVNVTAIHRLGNRFAYDFTFKSNLSRCLNVSVNAILGKISGNENEHRLHRNFESDFLSLGLNLEYNFRHFYKAKKRNPLITPFVSAGVYYSDYNPRSDLYDGDGNLYYYWQDGVIRNLPEGSLTPEDAVKLDRDYTYETHLTEKPITTLAFPVAGGFDFHLGNHVTFRLSASYFFTLSDKIDNYYDKNLSKSNDGYFYNSISVFFNFLYDKKEKAEDFDPGIYLVDFNALDAEDSDGDGVPDLDDYCVNTPANVKVTPRGCPLDNDNDGIADYRDKEPDTKQGYVVDENGVTLNFMNIAENLPDTAGMKRSSVKDSYIFSEKEATSQYTVHVATYGQTIPASQKQKLNDIEGLVETKKDTMTIYTLGNFSNFADAEHKQNELLENGYDQAFAATPKAVDAIAVELEKRAVLHTVKDKVAVNLTPVDTVAVKFKVQLTEYRLRLQIDKLADLMAHEGVELKTTIGGLKLYSIGSYNTYEEAQKIRKEILGYGVKEAEIIATINNRIVTVEEAKQYLKEQKK